MPTAIRTGVLSKSPTPATTKVKARHAWSVHASTEAAPLAVLCRPSPCAACANVGASTGVQARTGPTVRGDVGLPAPIDVTIDLRGLPHSHGAPTTCRASGRVSRKRALPTTWEGKTHAGAGTGLGQLTHGWVTGWESPCGLLRAAL